MSRLSGAIKLKIKDIVLIEHRPFSLADLKEFEVGGKKYKVEYGTLRNKISALKKAGEVEHAFRSRPAFYTIPARKFDKSMTLNHTGVPSAIIDPAVLKQTPIYKWIKNRPFNKQALHNIRLTFESSGVWHAFSRLYPDLIESNSHDIRLQSLTFFGYIDVSITVHHTNTVSVAVSCSCRPIAVDVKDIMQLFEALTITEVHIANIVDDYYKSNNVEPSSSSTTKSPNIIIPCYRKWIVKMWHFGFDSIDEYSGKEVNVTFEEGVSDLVRIYIKRMGEGANNNNNHRQKVRVERQEYPNQEAADAFVKKLFQNGHLRFDT